MAVQYIKDKAFMIEKLNWLDTESEISKPPPIKEEKNPFMIEGKRCPQCSWLERADAVECFRCGYKFEL